MKRWVKQMGVPTEVVYSLRILGLPPDANASEVRSAFRRLARTYHPDVAGRHYSHRFEQINRAYALLKELPREENSHTLGKDLENFSQPSKNAPKKEAWRRFSFRGVLGKPLVWYRKRQERLGAEKELLRHAAEDAREKTFLKRQARVDVVLDRGERLIGDLLSRKARETEDVDIHALVLRLASKVCQVRHLALARLGELANKPEAFEALLGSLQKWDIDDKTARLVSALPLKPENHRKLARGLAARAAVMPDALLSYLLQLHNPHAADRELLETYLARAGAGGVALILRRWPRGAFVSEPTLCRLISREDESVLVTTFGAMKQRSVPCPKSGLKLLTSYLSHPNVAVRIWAKALLPTA